MTKETFAILSNKEVIEINQDKLGEQGHKIKVTNVTQNNIEEKISESFLELVECNDKIQQKWYLREDGSISNNNEDFCIEVKTGLKKGDQIYSLKCKDIPGQKWTYSKEDKTIKSKIVKKMIYLNGNMMKKQKQLNQKENAFQQSLILIKPRYGQENYTMGIGQCFY